MTTVSNLYDVLYHYLTCVPHIRGEAVEVGVVIGDVVAIDLAPVIMIGVATPPVAITARVKMTTAVIVVAMTAVIFVVVRRIVEMVKAIESTVLFVVERRIVVVRRIVEMVEAIEVTVLYVILRRIVVVRRVEMVEAIEDTVLFVVVASLRLCLRLP